METFGIVCVVCERKASRRTALKTGKILLPLILACLLTFMTGCTVENTGDISKHNVAGITIAVSIMPEKAFVEAVCIGIPGIEVLVAIPPGYSPENYEPSPKHIRDLSSADIYFTIGVRAEEYSILPALKEEGGPMVVSLRDAAASGYEEIEISPGERDPHIWLSPQRAGAMVKAIGEELSKIDTLNSSKYSENMAKYLNELEELHNYLQSLFREAGSRDFIVFHPAYGYLASDYGLVMHSLEQEGKEATAMHLSEMVDLALEKGITTIFYQAEADSRQSVSFAEEISGTAVKLDPLSVDYIDNLKTMAKLITGGKQEAGTPK
ncbi:MAG: zinc ABC transporter substrate-binding protein [Eubacteriales bacterium]|nr:zinc ABC transporter substrate-binding protein [Eubacteriales bacterium]